MKNPATIMPLPLALSTIAVLVAGIGAAQADGERTPMFGGALTWSSGSERGAELVGGGIEIAWWPSRLGLAVEGSTRHGVLGSDLRVLALAGSARVLLVDWMWPSLFDDREHVEMAIELHAVAERTWYAVDSHVDGYGFGAAVRMRGGPDRDGSALLAESRLFVRVVRPRDDATQLVARATAMSTTSDRGITVLIGLGAAWGAANPGYLGRFRPSDE